MHSLLTLSIPCAPIVLIPDWIKDCINYAELFSFCLLRRKITQYINADLLSSKKNLEFSFHFHPSTSMHDYTVLPHAVTLFCYAFKGTHVEGGAAIQELHV